MNKLYICCTSHGKIHFTNIILLQYCNLCTRYVNVLQYQNEIFSEISEITVLYVFGISRLVLVEAAVARAVVRKLLAGHPLSRTSLTKILAQKQPPDVFYCIKSSVLKTVAKFTGKHLCQGLLFNKAVGLKFF